MISKEGKKKGERRKRILTDITDVILCSDCVKLFLFCPKGSDVMDGLRETVAFSYSLDLINPALLGEWTFSCNLKNNIPVLN